MEKRIAIFLLACCIISCNPSAEPISFGSDACHFCKMGIVDRQFGAESVTKKGRVYKYDAVECLINDLCENEELQKDNIYMLLAIDYNEPGKLIDFKHASILKSKAIPSPMGMNLSVFQDRKLANQQKDISGGEVFAAMDFVEKSHYNSKCVW